ncbi:MAG: VOC family protein [Caldilineaceae bacterium]
MQRLCPSTTKIGIAMPRRLASVTLVVHDYDEAINFFTGALRFRLLEDTRLSEEKRWVVVSPGDGGSTSLLLARAANETQNAHVGQQTGGPLLSFYILMISGMTTRI